MEEERRLFYVASSRAKGNLTITYHYDYNPNSLQQYLPFIKIDISLYHSVDNNFVEVKKQV